MAMQTVFERQPPPAGLVDRALAGSQLSPFWHFGKAIRSRYEDRDATDRRLASHFFTTFPQLDDIKFTHRWPGVIDTSTRLCAFFGSARSGRVAYADGFTGLGMAAARFAADVMLDRLDGAPTERTALDMDTATPCPFGQNHWQPGQSAPPSGHSRAPTIMAANATCS